MGPITAAHFDAAPRLRLLARYGVGVDAVDLASAARRHVTVTNIPGANTDGVADHAVALMLAALRQVTLGDRRVRAGNWRGQRARQLGHLTVGIVGVGRIGRAVAIRLSGFGGTVLGHDPWVPAQDLLAAGIEPVTMPELISRSDIVSLHLPGERTVIDANWLQQAKPGVVLVNTARATLVDEPALAAALRDGRVQVYAADTIATELATGSPSPLLNGALIDQTNFTPHWAAQTVEAVDNMSAGVVAAVLAVLRSETPPNIVPPLEPGLSR